MERRWVSQSHRRQVPAGKHHAAWWPSCQVTEEPILLLETLDRPEHVWKALELLDEAAGHVRPIVLDRRSVVAAGTVVVVIVVLGSSR